MGKASPRVDEEAALDTGTRRELDIYSGGRYGWANESLEERSGASTYSKGVCPHNVPGRSKATRR